MFVYYNIGRSNAFPWFVQKWYRKQLCNLQRYIAGARAPRVLIFHSQLSRPCLTNQRMQRHHTDHLQIVRLAAFERVPWTMGGRNSMVSSCSTVAGRQPFQFWNWLLVEFQAERIFRQWNVSPVQWCSKQESYIPSFLAWQCLVLGPSWCCRQCNADAV